MLNKIYDVIIIGCGPAGASAAIYAVRKKLKTLVISKDIGGQLLITGHLENYLGFIGGNGIDLVEIIKKQLEALNIEIKYEEVKKVEKENDIFKVITEKETFLGKAIIATGGSIPKKLGIPEEENFIGRGISYCAICDAPFARNKVAAVVGGGNSAFHALITVAKYANKVYLIHRRDEFRADAILIDQAKKLNNVEFLTNTIIEKIIGKEKVEGIIIKNLLNGTSYELKVNVVFVEIGREVHVDYIKHLVNIDENNRIIVDKYQRTSCKGIFAAGDITDRPYKQAIISAGDGAVAALSAYDYLIYSMKNGTSPKK
ncbi:MAG: FAD-dependent oxidoreductase [Candidatus Methanomethylicaceae archaeon]|nr:FAD-dependent oxidoreductase [Candidatus Verstraetearchaeota archaeon]